MSRSEWKWLQGVVLGLTCTVLASAQTQQPGPKPSDEAPHAKQVHMRHLLVVGASKGFEHDTISDAMVAVYEMGQQTGLWDTVVRTDTELVTKKKIGRNAKNLDYFDAIVLASTTGEMELDADQKADLLSFVKTDGKGFVGIHAALDANYNWPEYSEMIGGWFDQHPWGTFNAPILNESPDFPAVRHLPSAFLKYDEIYQPKNWTRANVNVLLSLDASKLKFEGNPRIHRTDRDFPIAWTKMYGKGRVFYSTLGHTEESWKDPDVRTMYLEAIKWSLGLTEGSTASHAALKAAPAH